MILVTIFPAFAADDGIYRPVDYEVGKPIVDSATGIITYSYEFDVTPRLNSYFDDVYNSSDLTDSVRVYPPVGTKKITIRTYPLGVYGYSNSNWPKDRGVVDVRDFKSYSQFELSATFHVTYGMIMQPAGKTEVRSFWSVYCYDDSGWYTGTIQSTTSVKSFDVQSSNTIGYSYDCGGIIELPEGTSYILPCCISSVYSPGTTAAVSYDISVTDLRLDFSIDSFVENSLAMQAIKEQLLLQYGSLENINDVLGDTFDSLFGSDYEGKDEVEQNKQNSETTVEDIEDAIGRLEAIESDISGLTYDSLTSFLRTRPWNLVKDLVSPIMDWGQSGIIMLLVVSLVNLSVILLGR